jgi:putative acetyltransferase
MLTRLHISIERVNSPTEDVRTLTSELYAELSANYPPEQRHALSLDAIFQPHIRFFIARIDGCAVGCGGVALFADFAEVKRMYVRPEFRGKGGGNIAEAIVARLTREALDAGLTTLRLETGTEQAAAIRFYERCGFKRCEPFEPYASMPPQAISTRVVLAKQRDAG